MVDPRREWQLHFVQNSGQNLGHLQIQCVNLLATVIAQDERCIGWIQSQPPSGRAIRAPHTSQAGNVLDLSRDQLPTAQLQAQRSLWLTASVRQVRHRPRKREHGCRAPKNKGC